MNLKKLVTIILCAIILNLVVISGDSSDDELEDFEFISPTEVKHYDYYEEPEKNDKLDEFFFTSQEDDNSFSNHLDIKEKVIRKALAKALTNKVLRQKFVEVIPILRVLSSQQRLALSALISAQISAKPGSELKLDQVKSMFGDYRKLIIPLVFDIANLVKTAAKNSLHYAYEFSYAEQKHHPNKLPLSRRHHEEMAVESRDGEIFLTKEKIDPLMINDELYRIRNSRKLDNSSNTTQLQSEQSHSRTKRSSVCKYPCPFTNYSRDGMLNGQTQQPSAAIIQNRSFQDNKLNTSNFISPFQKGSPSVEDSTKYEVSSKERETLNMPYEEVENLAFFDLNGTVSGLSINASTEDLAEVLPSPESLVASRLRSGNKLGNGPRKPPQRAARPRSPMPKKCEKFTSSMCIKAEDYPTEQILGSIRRHKHAMSALLAEYRDKAAEVEHEEYMEEMEHLQKRRDDGDNEVSPGGMCQSVVKYARPQKARSASGDWKYIVNTGQHTQTLRLEKCSNPHSSCSYLSENYRSRCVQVYNYHRLLSWDKARGLHVEIFKVPICCACHVDGYRDPYPPASGGYPGKPKEYSLYKQHPYTTIDDDEYEEDDADEGDDSIAYQFANGFKKVKPNKYDPGELISSSATLKNRYEGTKKHKFSPSYGSHASPPAGAFDPQYNFKRGPNLFPSVGGHLGGLNRHRRPQQHAGYESDDRADQESSGSELGKEVTVYPTIDRTTVRPKRKRVSSVSTATAKPPSAPSYPPSTGQTATSPKNFHPPKVSGVKADGSKRINYNYHPIIDFFGDQTMASAASKKQKRVGSTPTKTRRVGQNEPEDTWRPIIVE